MILTVKIGDYSSTATYDLKFRIRDTEFAQVWANQLRSNIDSGFSIRENGRFVGLSPNTSSESFYCGQISLALKIINKFSPIDIDPGLISNLDQQKLNILHDKFDQMCGPEGFSKVRSEEVQVALECLNESIHSLENIIAQKEFGSTPIPYLYVEFPEAKKLKLPEVALDDFSLKRRFGDLFVHYSQVGKSILDAFEDNDVVMQESNIRPHEYYDGSFDIRFRGWSDQKVDDLSGKLSAWMESQSFNPNDRKWAIGWLVVGDLILGDQTEEEVVKSVGQCCQVLSVSLEG